MQLKKTYHIRPNQSLGHQPCKFPFSLKDLNNRSQPVTNNLACIKHPQFIIKIHHQTNRQNNIKSLQDNNRIQSSLKQLQLWLNIYEQDHLASYVFSELLFAFQDYQYLYMVYNKIQGYSFDYVLKHHVFKQEETQYAVVVMIQLMEYFHQKKYSLCELSPECFMVQKQTGKLKLVQIFNPMPIDLPYNYNIITTPSVYSAPEVLAKNKILAQSDYYSLGMIMYEMMTQKKLFLEQNQRQQIDAQSDSINWKIIQNKRNQVRSPQIQIKKYNLPENWDLQSADFLVKLLVKNPLYRLGRYGSFQLQFHPWLKNYNWQALPSKFGISLNEECFKLPQKNQFPTPYKKQIEQQQRKKILKDPLFLKIFQKYKYRKDLSILIKQKTQKNDQKISFNQIRHKKSQKYYDNNSQIQQSDEQELEEQNIYNFDQESLEESMGRSDELSKSKKRVRGGHGRGLLNIVDLKKKQ